MTAYLKKFVKGATLEQEAAFTCFVLGANKHDPQDFPFGLKSTTLNKNGQPCKQAAGEGLPVARREGRTYVLTRLGLRLIVDERAFLFLTKSGIAETVNQMELTTEAANEANAQKFKTLYSR